MVAIVRRVSEIDLSRFADRLILQKTVYFLQLFGFFLGYRFSWYLYGPYSPDLTKDAFAVEFDSVELAAFSDTTAEQRFDTFLRFLGTKKRDPAWLEALASLHCLAQLYPTWSEQQVRDLVLKKQPYFTEELVTAALQHLKAARLV